MEIERDAERHLQDYQTRVVSSFGKLDEWKTEGHKLACLLLEPTLSWFERQSQHFPPIQRRKKFVALQEDAFQRLAILFAIDIGTVTTYGAITEKLGSGYIWYGLEASEHNCGSATRI